MNHLYSKLPEQAIQSTLDFQNRQTLYVDIIDILIASIFGIAMVEWDV